VVVALSAAGGVAGMALGCGRGREGRACRGDGTCAPALTCISHYCVDSPRPAETAGLPGGAIISSSPDSFVEAESTVAVSPEGTVVAAWIASDAKHGRRRIGYAFSNDGGGTWGAPAILDDRFSADPMLAVDHRGAFYLSFVGAAPDYTPSVFVSSAPHGATRFSSPVRVSDPDRGRTDLPTIAVTSRGTVLVTYDLVDAVGDAEVARSEDGATWTRTMIKPTAPRYRWLFRICTSQHEDRAWVAYADAEAYGVQWTNDDGRSWSVEATVSLTDERGRAGAVLPSCAGEGTEFYYLYGLTDDPHAYPLGTPRASALRLAHSTDGGETFGAYLSAHDPLAGDLFLLPQLGLAADGTLHVLYYAGGRENGAPGSLLWSVSRDRGTTFSPAVPLDEDIRFERRVNARWLGHYLGLYIAGHAMHVAYADNSGSSAHVAYLRRSLP
jgi:hypothetical protein